MLQDAHLVAIRAHRRQRAIDAVVDVLIAKDLAKFRAEFFANAKLARSADRYVVLGITDLSTYADGHLSLTAGTVLHNTKLPLTVWFWAAYLMTTDKRGISALLLQRQLGLHRYETAWMLLHKLRRAMVNAAREPLHGDVELDDTWIDRTTTLLLKGISA